MHSDKFPLCIKRMIHQPLGPSVGKKSRCLPLGQVDSHRLELGSSHPESINKMQKILLKLYSYYSYSCIIVLILSFSRSWQPPPSFLTISVFCNFCFTFLTLCTVYGYLFVSSVHFPGLPTLLNSCVVIFKATILFANSQGFKFTSYISQSAFFVHSKSYQP